MARILMRDMAWLRELRDDDPRNPRPIAKEIQRLNLTRVIVTAAFIERQIAVSAHRAGLPFTPSTVFFAKPETNRASRMPDTRPPNRSA